MSARLAGTAETMLFAAACGHPSDRYLISNFNEHESQFVKLTLMAERDKNVISIATNWTCCPTVNADERMNEITRPPREARLSERRWNEYRDLFRVLNLEAGITKLRQGGSVQFFESTMGLLNRGSIKGYVYSRIPLTPVVESLDDLPSRP
jgi:hypothetical protein